MYAGRTCFSTCYKDTLSLQLAAAGMAAFVANRQWVADIATFNWAGGVPPAQIKFLNVGMFPAQLSAQLELASISRGWRTNKTICENLNIPLKFGNAPLEYKYMYEHYKKFNTLEMRESLKDSEFLNPLEDKELESFIAFF